MLFAKQEKKDHNPYKGILILIIILSIFTVLSLPLSAPKGQASSPYLEYGESGEGIYEISYEVDTDFTAHAYEEETSWWVGADPHINHFNYNDGLRVCVEDVNTLETDYAIVLGDLVHDGKDAVTDFNQDMDALNHDWTYILGNHDHARGEAIKEVNYFSEVVNGVRIIALSDESPESNVCKIGEEQDKWLKETLEENPDIPTVIMTHQCPIQGSVTSFDDWMRDNTEEYNIVLWITGHAHRWDFDEDVGEYDFDRLKVNSIFSYLGSSNLEGMLMSIDKIDRETAEVKLEFRDHGEREWIPIEERGLQLQTPEFLTLIAIIGVLLTILIILCDSKNHKK